jgi:exosortase H (IPTLxxWG-CTERM-specific)
MAKTNTRGEGQRQHGEGRRGGTLPIVRFVVTTIVSLVALFYAIRQPYIVTHFVEPYTNFIAAVSRAGLRLVGVDATGSTSFIASPEFAVTIKNVCNGLEVTAIFFATILGFPSSWKSKLLGLAVGYPVIFAINILRIIVLFLLGFKVPNVFDAVHYYYAQAFVIIATVAVWLLWVIRFSNYGAATSSTVCD